MREQRDDDASVLCVIHIMGHGMTHYGTSEEDGSQSRFFIPLLVWLITKRAIAQQCFMQYLCSHIPLHDEPANLAMAMTGNGCIHTYEHTHTHAA